MLIAQISDTHIREPGQLCCGRVDTATFLAKAVAKLNSLPRRPDVVIVTGDLVDLATPAEYAHLARLLGALEAPFYLVMGNHDHRERLRAAFPEHDYLGVRGSFVQYAVESFAVRLLVLDTNVPNQSAGRLCEERLAWLAAKLTEQPDRPTVVAMHHPPFATGNTACDRFALAGSDGLARVIANHTNIHAIVSGHLHRATQARFAGTLAMTCPSTAHQLHFGLGDSPFGFDLEPPAFQLHLWAGNVLVTHSVLVDRFEGPYSFEDGQPISA
ncbi:3',5'-cyclic-nucleotide phosphodiesterase [Labilithrix luteola]|uniref:3',5'-cyclic-nucleotide phosphodiesterase n=1 Tax=Labilithrix luteola TaxID=1391654 RepID=A0A0K1Q6P9_9BACT|nr:phosphodiesterase [Labilithrix luteola]AKV01322.1 3',5'-cyclic-nucleotide phosphodiesterase [Labilithrix luteola]